MNTQTLVRITFVLPSLKAGGAERVMSFVSQNLDKQKFKPFLLVAGFAEDTVYDVSGVEVIYLNKSRILSAIPQIIKHLIQYNPDIVLSSIAHVNKAMAIISPFFRNTKFIGREATILGKNNNRKIKTKSLVNIIPVSFNKLDALICQSKDMAMDMINNFNVSKDKIHVINNPISNEPQVKKKFNNDGLLKLITVGRLTKIKGHLRILNVLSQMKIPFKYTIIGDGELRSEIFEKARILNIIDKIEHIPFTSEVNKFLARHDLFLQGSYVEGFPNALLESCVIGTPVLAFNAPGGTKEIIENGINGFMVETEVEYLKVLKSSFNFNPEEVSESVYRKFNQNVIIKKYEDLFIKITKK